MNHLIKLPRNAAGLTIVNDEDWQPGEGFTIFFTTVAGVRANSPSVLAVTVYPAGDPANEPEARDLKLSAAAAAGSPPESSTRTEDRT
jgi:hypothetical protein